MKRIFLLPLILAIPINAIPRSYIEFARSILLGKKPIDKIIFVPGKEEHPKHLLLGLIQSEQSKISAALFRFSDKDIAQELVNAVDRGVDVELIVDQGCFTENSKVANIVTESIPVYIYSGYFSIMHHKMFLFKNNLEGKNIVWHGSANATMLGLSKNQECISIREGQELYKRFDQHFNQLKNQIAQDLPSSNTKQLGYFERWLTSFLKK